MQKNDQITKENNQYLYLLLIHTFYDMEEDRDIELTITLNETQARVIMEALELFARINIGQIDAISTVFLFRKKWDWDQFHYYENGLKRVLFPQLTTNESYGIYSSEAGERAQVAWDIHQVIRHDLSWFLHPGGGMTVNFHEPMKTSKHPLPKVNITEEEKK